MNIPIPTSSPSMRVVPHEQAEPSIRDLFAVCRQRKRLLLLCSLSAAALALGWSLLQIPVYQSKATVVVDIERPGTLNTENYSDPGNRSPEYFQTHFELMKSYEVLRDAAALLRLSEQPEYFPTPSRLDAVIQGLMALLPSWEESSMPRQDDRAEQDRLLQLFSTNIEITPVRGARLAHVVVYSQNPDFAALAANTLARVYIEHNQRLTSQSKQQMAQWFTAHSDGLREKVQQTQEALYRFRLTHGLLEGRDKQTAATQRMTDLSSELVKAETRKSELESRLGQIRSILHGNDQAGSVDLSQLDMSAEVLNSPLIQGLRLQEARVSGELADLAEKYGPRHPKLAQGQAELRELRGQIGREMKKLLDSVSREFEVARAREQALRRADSQHNKDRLSLGHLDIEQGFLEREAESSQHLYDMFLKVAKESDLSRGMMASNVYVADAAVPAVLPVKPKKKLISLLGLVGGLLSGVGLALVTEGRRPRIRGPEDIGTHFPGVALLGVVPLMAKKTMARLTHPSEPDRQLPVLESFRIIRTSLLLAQPQALPSQVLVTSPGESEGKTMLAVNLAAAFAQLDDTRVLLIDADFRQSPPHPVFAEQGRAQGAPGLAHVLSGEATPQQACRPTHFPNLLVMSKGMSPANPTELLHSKHFGTLLAWCREQGLQVVIDAPPILPVADSLVMANQVDGVLMVAGSGTTTQEACRYALRRVTEVGGHVFGVVLQKARRADLPSYYGTPSPRDHSSSPYQSI